MNPKSLDHMDAPDDLEIRLLSLPHLLGDGSEFVRNVLARLQTESIATRNIRSNQIKRWMTRTSIGLAASLLITAFIWSLATSPPQAFAMDEVSKHILSLDSLHIKGTIYPPDGSPGRPLELFAQQPDHCRINGRLESGPQGASSTDLIITPQRSITIDSSAKTATIVPGNSQDARSQVARILQGMIGQMMFGQTPGFKQLRSEKIGGIETDLYENRVDPHIRLDIWLNPATGLPVQTQMYQIETGSPDRLAVQFDTIEANPTIAADIFDAAFGPGWTITESKGPPDANGLANNSIQFGNLCLSVRYLISLDKGNVLICWCLYNTNHPDKDMNLPDTIQTLTFKASGGPSYTEHLLHADPSPRGFHWRWSLLRPDKTPAASMVLLSVSARTVQGNSGDITDIPVIYPPQQLARQIQLLQKQTLPETAAPMTLEQIELSEQK